MTESLPSQAALDQISAWADFLRQMAIDPAHSIPATAQGDLGAFRTTRLAREFLIAEDQLLAHNIRSTMVFFGSARATPNATHPKPVDAYYAPCRELAQWVAQQSCRLRQQQLQHPHWDFVVTTGGGPGLMEAANRGAHDAQAPSIGMNITLPHEQFPNPYLSKGLHLRFHYFATRKLHFLMRAKALVLFPGGFGTLDELFDALTLIQTGKMPKIPVLLFGKDYWQKLLSFDQLVDYGTIAPADLDLIQYVDEVGAARTVLCQAFPELAD